MRLRQLQVNHCGLLAVRPSVHMVCVNVWQIKPFWEFSSRCMKNKPLNRMTVSAVHSQLCRALKELEFKWREKKTNSMQTYNKCVEMNCSLNTHRHHSFPATLNNKQTGFLQRWCRHRTCEHQGVCGGLGEGHEPWLSKLAALPGHCKVQYHKTTTHYRGFSVPLWYLSRLLL